MQRVLAIKKWIQIVLAILPVATCVQGQTSGPPPQLVLEAAFSLITNRFPAVTSDQLTLINWNRPGANPENGSNYRLCFSQAGGRETNYIRQLGQPLEMVESSGYVVLMDARFQPFELPDYNLIHGVITTRVGMATTLLLPGDPRIANCAAEYPYRTIENLSREVSKSLPGKTRAEVKAMLGDPAKTYPQDGGEAWEYLSEHQQLVVVFYDKGIVGSLNAGANPEFIRRSQALTKMIIAADTNQASGGARPVSECPPHFQNHLLTVRVAS